MKRKADIFVEGLKIPYLYGDKDEYGIKYPTGYKVSGKPRVDVDFAGGGGYSGDPALVARALEMIQPEAEEIPMGQPTAKPTLPDRETYTKELDRRLEAQFGRDPRAINIFGEALKMYNEKLKPFWSHVFPKIPHGGMLDEDQQKFWMKSKEQLMARCYNSVKGHVETQTGMYKRARAEGMVLYEDKREEAEKGITGAAQIGKEERTLGRQLEKEKRAEATQIRKEQRAKRVADITKLTDFKWAFTLWKKRNLKGTVEQFKREWEKPTGGLTEGAVVKSINEMSWNAEDPVQWTTDTYDKYLEHRAKGLSREQALNKVQKEMAEIKLPSEIKTTSQAMEYLKSQGMNEQQAKDWLRSQR